MSTLIFFGILAVVLIYIISLYNHLVSVKHAVAKAWANIDVLLKQRHDELPKLVEVCKQYKQFEQSTLQKVIEARSQVQAARQQQQHDIETDGDDQPAPLRLTGGRDRHSVIPELSRCCASRQQWH